jgi:hypothetical protein
MNCSAFNIAEESPKNHLEMISKLYTGDSDLYAWQAKLVKAVKVVSVEKIPEIANDVYRLIKMFQAKQCYQNAYQVASHISGVEYVEGFADIVGIPIDHAFNVYKGQYFDVTGELVLKREVEKDVYFKVMTYSHSEMNKLAVATGTYGGYLKAYYKLFIKKEAA